jgi:hypothetical protein
MRSATSRQISSANIIRQYHPRSTAYDHVLPSSLPTSHTISLPFTYYNNSPLKHSKTNFEKISAWLDHTETMAKHEHDRNGSLVFDRNQQRTKSSASTERDNQGKMNSISFLFFSLSKKKHLTMIYDILLLPSILFFSFFYLGYIQLKN